MHKKITHAQALEVGRRLNPTNDHPIQFRANGSVVHNYVPSPDWAGIELWECWRDVGTVHVAKLPSSAATAPIEG